jgi:NTE family protein
MVQTHTKTAIAFQGGGALGAFAFGALRHIYESEPDFKPSCVSGVSIGAFTAAIVASHPANPLPKLEAFWNDLTVFHSSFLPAELEKHLALFGNSKFYWPRLDYALMPSWTSFYDLGPIAKTLEQYVDFAVIAKGEVKLVVTATDIETGEIAEFGNSDPKNPISMKHLIASGSLPPSYPPKKIDNHTFWDGGLFDNTPLSALLGVIDRTDAATTRVLVINLFPNNGRVPKTMLDVWDRMIELQFANKTAKDVELAQKINKLVAVIEKLDITKLNDPKLTDVAKYKVFENIIPITNAELEPVSSSSDFSQASIKRRIEAGYRAAVAALSQRPESMAEFKAAI